MKLKSTFVVIALLASLSINTAQAQTTKMVNPLTYTDIPDNDVIRVGDDFYMVSTTMFFCPGAPIMHSKDLVHWRIILLMTTSTIYAMERMRMEKVSGQPLSATTMVCSMRCLSQTISTRHTYTAPPTSPRAIGSAMKSKERSSTMLLCCSTTTAKYMSYMVMESSASQS